ncbi:MULTISPECIES: hypothetical protein [unclassified Mesorhizobium]|uniref:hypothetical protein n=1 Tax=unclassified Mesorhizobium TaxID=325217 RepID=UPI00333B7F9B
MAEPTALHTGKPGGVKNVIAPRRFGPPMTGDAGDMADGQGGILEPGITSYDGFFADAIARLQGEWRYRVFADLERIAGRAATRQSRLSGE